MNQSTGGRLAIAISLFILDLDAVYTRIANIAGEIRQLLNLLMKFIYRDYWKKKSKPMRKIEFREENYATIGIFNYSNLMKNEDE